MATIEFKRRYKWLKKPLTKQQKLRVLRRTRELLSENNSWAKNTFHRPWANHDRPQMCLAGAAQFAAREFGYLEQPPGYMNNNENLVSTEVADEISLKDLVESKGYPGVPDFNDNGKTTRKDVLALIDERIEQLGGK